MADIRAALQRRSKSLILGSTAAVLVIVAGLQLVHLQVARSRTLASAAARAEDLAAVLTEYVQGSFTAADTTLRQLTIHSPRLGGPSGPADAWMPLLTATQEALPGGGSLSITDSAGLIRHSTVPDIVGESRRDGYLFSRLSTSGVDELVIDRPFLTVREPRRYILPVGRALRTASGTFNGAVVATMLPTAYGRFFRTVDVGPGGIIWVFHPDGVVLFREPSETRAINLDAAHHPLVVAARRGEQTGQVTGPLEPGGPAFISAFDQTERPHLIVAVSLDEAAVLADWHHQRLSLAFAFGVLAVTLGGVVFVAFRQMDARARLEAELGAVQRLEAERLRAVNQQLEEALEREQQARRETEQASYMKDEFLMTVSHELRTPLNSIYGWVRMLGTDILPADQRQRAVDAVERNARAQARLIEDLLDVSSSMTGRLRLEAKPTDVADAVATAIETSRPALEAKALQFEASMDPGLPLILADPLRLQQVVWNLLSNAIKFTPEGGRVSISVARAGSSIDITVSDTGIGIEPDFMPFVFERFRQGEGGTRRRYGGLGLGLAIVRHLVELHGGTITVTSAGAGTGTTVRVRIPARPARSEPATA